MGLLAKTLSALGFKSAEGEFREGPYNLPITGGWLSADAGQYANWWQMGYDVTTGRRSAMVEACIASYAQTAAMCPGSHWKWSKEKGRERVTGSALTRILKTPNDYQSISDFLLNATANLLDEGNCYAVALRNNRYEIQELHLMNPRRSGPQLAVTGEVFYHLGGNEILEARIGTNIIAPARDVLHIRLQTPRHPLIGEPPIAAAALQLAAGNAALQQQIQFYLNQARPSFVLSTDQTLNKDQVKMLRDSWNEQAKGLNRGGTPILSSGLKPSPLSTTAKDSDLADILKMSNEAIAHVYRVPLQILGTGDTPYASTEALMQSWRAGGLGFILNHIEEAMGNLFKLGGQPDEYLELDTSALLRSAFKDRVEGWARGVQSGIFARNEARYDFEQAPVEFGDEPWVQQQDIPLSVAGNLAKNPPEPPAPPPPPANDAEPDPEQARAAVALFKEDLREALRA